MKKIQEQGLRFVYEEYNCDYCLLLKKEDFNKLYMGRLRSLFIEVYKALGGHGPLYLQDIFKNKYSFFISGYRTKVKSNIVSESNGGRYRYCQHVFEELEVLSSLFDLQNVIN